MKVKLRAIREDDLDKIMKWRMEPSVTKYMYTDPSLNLDLQKAWFKKVANDSTCKYWIITVDGKDIGVFNITDIDRKNSRCEWGYYIADTSLRGKGIARLLECNIYDYVFQVLEINKLCCEVFCFNEKVIHIHEKFGSVVEGTRKQHICKNGHFYDIVEMAILRERWELIKANYEYEKIDIEEV